MAKDVTISVGGRNPDGTFNATIGGIDPGNPLLSSGATPSTGIVPYNAQQTLPQQGYRARVGSVEIIFASEADFLKADRVFREMITGQQGVPQAGNVPSLGGTSGGTTGWLRTGAHAAEAVTGILRDRGIRRKLDDLDLALRDSRDARRDLDSFESSNPTYAPLVGILRKLFDAERDATEAAVSTLEDELTAVDIQTGAGVAKVVADFMTDAPSTGSSFGGGTGSALAAGGIGLGVGMLLSRDSDRRRRR